MLQQDLLKLYRQREDYSQVTLAEKLHVTPQAISKWESGTSVPSLDNLLALCDLYNLSLDELVQAGPYFKKPFVVGRCFSWPKALIALSVWTLFNLIFTGFGYQPWWLFAIILVWGILMVVPLAFKDYWVIERDGICVTRFSPNPVKKWQQLVFGQPHEQMTYAEIHIATLYYHAKEPTSPFDFWRDTLTLQIEADTRQLELPIEISSGRFLPQLMSFLSRQHVQVNDPQHVIEALLLKGNLYETFH